MPISRADFDRGKDVRNLESEVERILADGQGYTDEELADKIWGREAESGSIRVFVLGFRLDHMVSDKRIVAKQIDQQIYYAKR
jgi:hypothetical protein